MGLSGSKQTTTNVSGPSPQALPFLTSASGAVQGAYDANQGNLSQIGTGLSDAFKAKLAEIQGGGDPTVAAARGYTGDVLGGKFLGAGNPYTGDIINTTNNDITDRINALFSRSGQTGSSRQIGELGKQLSANESALRYNDYNTERGRMDSAVGSAAGLQGVDNADLASLLGLGTSAAETPYTGAKFLSQGLGGLWGNAQQNTQTTTGGGGLGSVLGSLLTGAAMVGTGGLFPSDRRLKRDIVKLGSLDDGLGIYSYRYIWSDKPKRGVMADEVARLRPWALGPVLNGYATVNYGAL